MHEKPVGIIPPACDAPFSGRSLCPDWANPRPAYEPVAS